MNKPLISIILPVYNGQDYLIPAVESILNQTYKNFELIIVDDASTDNTPEIVDEFAKQDARIRVIHNKENKKLPASLNIGHRVAKGRYVTWTSHDNLLKPVFLEKLFGRLREKDADIIYSDYDLIDRDGNIYDYQHTEPHYHLIFGNTIGAAFLYKREVFEKLNGYIENLYLVEDYDFWLRAFIHGFEFIHSDSNNYLYRKHPESLTHKIHSDNKVGERHKKAIADMYGHIGKILGWSGMTAELLSRIHLREPISIMQFLNNKETYFSDLKKLPVSELEYRELMNKLNTFLRRHWIKEKDNKKISTYINVLFHYPSLLFRNISYKFAIKMLLKTIMK